MPIKERVLIFMPYVRSTWIESSRFHPGAWSTYGMEIRTNNDCEGWHYGLNRAGNKPSFYTLLDRIDAKCEEAALSIRRVGEDVAVRRVEEKMKKKQAFLQTQWRLYEEKKLSARRLLKTIANSDIADITDDITEDITSS